MSRRMQRAIRKQFLQIQAEHLRLALRQDLDVLHPLPGTGANERSVWLETVGGLLGVLPGRWGRWLPIGLTVWRIVRILTKALCAGKISPEEPV